MHEFIDFVKNTFELETLRSLAFDKYPIRASFTYRRPVFAMRIGFRFLSPDAYDESARNIRGRTRRRRFGRSEMAERSFASGRESGTIGRAPRNSDLLELFRCRRSVF